MKKYRINKLVVLRNISIVGLLVVLNRANAQIVRNEQKLKEFRLEIAKPIAISASLPEASGLPRNDFYILGDKEYTQEEKIAQKQSSAVLEPSSGNQIEEIQENYINLGKFKITHYCACKKCCGPNAQGITASGKRVKEGVTIAVDPKVIKLGSKVKIADYGEYEAQDTGSAIKGNKIDVYIADHQRALQMGVTYKNVWLKK